MQPVNHRRIKVPCWRFLKRASLRVDQHALWQEWRHDAHRTGDDSLEALMSKASYDAHVRTYGYLP